MNKFKKLFVIFICSFFFVMNVNAETGIVTDGSGVNMRVNPSTDSEIINAIPKNKEFYISNLKAGTGNGCDSDWFYVYYNNSYGYVCSLYVDVKSEEGNANLSTSYGRPWTTPKKAIIGGAQFISESYIAKGQYTSYLKKFNVNPNGYYSVYNHQYMANLRAPSSEAYSSYSSLKKNGFLDNAMNFVIPEFTNMPESTYDINIKDTERQTAGVQDKKFEKSIKDFDESYKPYLRYLHTIHPNWTFTVMKTGLDFEVSYLSEKAVSSIEISSGMCEQNPYYQTESGWCIGSEAATKFFLDPRNFLSEKYIFMFENLSYSDKYTEKLVQSILDNTFMSGISALDNQSYASIFVEAGSSNNVSPLYLASLARQESGTKLSLTTSGNPFTYNGFSYSGLYNFFNIGAYSSESNPAKAGLVYANGGQGTSQGNSNNKVEIDDIVVSPTVTDFKTLLNLRETGGYLRGYQIGTTVASIKSVVGLNATLEIKDPNGVLKSDGEKIGTGYTITISNGSETSTYTYVMYGDLTGDGEINSADLLKLRQHLLGTNTLSGVYKSSAYIDSDSNINSADLLKIRQYLLGTANIYQ